MGPWGVKRLFRFSSGTGNEVQADIAEEFAFHLEARIDELMRTGLGEADARAQAAGEFGDRASGARACAQIDEPLASSSTRPADRHRRVAQRCLGAPGRLVLRPGRPHARQPARGAHAALGGRVRAARCGHDSCPGQPGDGPTRRLTRVHQDRR
jgi:hypothetical protein